MRRLIRGLLSGSLAIDLGSSSVKVVALRGKTVSLAALREITPAERAEEESLIRLLSTFFREVGISGRDCIIGLTGASCFVRTVILPKMPEQELREAVRWEVKRQIPFPQEEGVHDYQSREVPEGIAVTFAAAERSSVEKRIALFRQAGLRVTAVDSLPLALLRVCPFEDSTNNLILDIGHQHTELSVVRDGILRLTRSVEMGGETIENSLIAGGMDPDESHKALSGPLTDALKEPVNQILREVSRSIDYYKANYKEKAFSSLIFTGGLSLNHEIGEYLFRSLGLGRTMHDPFSGLALKDPQVRSLAPRFSVAAGLARRGV